MSCTVRIAIAALLLLPACRPEQDDRGPAEGGPAARAPLVTTVPPVTRVLLITLDTVRADRVGSYGCSRPLTPRLDELAKGGTRFARAAAPMPETAPSHASMLSGRSPLSHGLINHYIALSNEVETAAEVLARARVATGAFYHFFPFGEFNVTQGFDVRFRDMSRDASAIPTRFFTWLDSLPADQPLFAWLHLYLAHVPYKPPEELRSRFVRHPYAEHLDSRIPTLTQLMLHPESEPPGYAEAFGELYDASVAWADQRLGTILDGLVARGVADDMLLIVTSDHGESLDAGRFGFHAFDARQTTLHVPLVMHGPRVPAGRTEETIVQLVDLYPTLLEPFGIVAAAGSTSSPSPSNPPSAANIEGRSLWPLLAGDPTEGEAAAWGSLPVEPEEFASGKRPRHLTYWKAGFKLVVEDPEGAARERLFDPDKDPDELHDLAADHPEIVRALRSQLDAAIESARSKQTSPGELTEVGKAEMKALGYIK